MDFFVIKAENVSRRFGTATVFKNISFSAETGGPLAVTGPNGSGKSTLLQIVAGLQRADSGVVTRSINGAALPLETFSANMAYTGPLVNPYDMLTARENLEFTIKGGNARERISNMLEYFNLYRDRDKIVKHYSSGMKQKLKLIHALINNPAIILLDEPSSNLDSQGKDRLFTELERIKENRILIIASNEQDEINLCSGRVELGKQNI